MKYILVGFCFVFAMCKSPKEEQVQPAKGKVYLSFKPSWFEDNFRLNTKLPFPNGDTLNLRQVRFYLSNIVLLDSSKNVLWKEDSSYHLFDVPSDGSQFKLKLHGGASGIKPRFIRLSIGVDSIRNRSLDNFGDLDITNGMGWDWNVGYKFWLMEGNVSNAIIRNKNFVYHLGTNANYRILEFPLSTRTTLEGGKSLTISFNLKFDKVFSGVNQIDPITNNDIMFEPTESKLVMNNIVAGVLNLKGDTLQ